MHSRQIAAVFVILAALVGVIECTPEPEQIQKQLLNAFYRVLPRGILYGSRFAPYLKAFVGTPPESDVEQTTESVTTVSTTESTTDTTTRIALHPFLWILGREIIDSSSEPPTIEEINVLEDRIERFHKQGKEMIYELRKERKRYQLEQLSKPSTKPAGDSFR